MSIDHVRFPRWGIRIKCTKIPNPATNMSVSADVLSLRKCTDRLYLLLSVSVSPSGFSYVYTPRSTLQGLFEDFSMSLPDALQAPVNLTRVLMGNDTAPAGLNVAETAMGGAWLYLTSNR